MFLHASRMHASHNEFYYTSTQHVSRFVASLPATGFCILPGCPVLSSCMTVHSRRCPLAALMIPLLSLFLLHIMAMERLVATSLLKPHSKWLARRFVQHRQAGLTLDSFVLLLGVLSADAVILILGVVSSPRRAGCPSSNANTQLSRSRLRLVYRHFKMSIWWYDPRNRSAFVSQWRRGGSRHKRSTNSGMA